MSSTIWNGDSRSVSIDTGKKLSVVAVSGTYTVLTTAGVGAGTALATNATGGTYGPYAGPITVLLTSSALSEVDYDVAVTPVIESDTTAKIAVNPLTRGNSLVLPDGTLENVGARQPILLGASAGADSGWLPLSKSPERFVYQLDSGTTTTTFSVDISADGSTSLGQAFTGTYASSTVAEITFPLMFSNPLAKFFRWNVVSGGPLSVSRGA